MFSEEGKEIRCNLRGKFKKKYALKKDKLSIIDVAVIGDTVEYNPNDDGTGTIFEIFERKNHLSRKAPKIKGASFRGERLEQIIASNIDRLFIITSVAQPSFNNRMLDRILVAGESSHIEPIIVINKYDLDDEDYIIPWKELYEEIGYKVLITSVTENIGLEELRETMRNGSNVFWGQSGVGKSSLLNALYPELNFRVGEVSEATLKGRHTTVTGTKKEVAPNTFIIDTPGVREIDPYGITKEDLCHYFIEFQPFIHDCKFNTCTHNHEPGCAIVDAVNEEEISVERYESYLNILYSVEDDMIF